MTPTRKDPGRSDGAQQATHWGRCLQNGRAGLSTSARARSQHVPGGNQPMRGGEARPGIKDEGGHGAAARPSVPPSELGAARPSTCLSIRAGGAELLSICQSPGAACPSIHLSEPGGCTPVHLSIHQSWGGCTPVHPSIRARGLHAHPSVRATGLHAHPSIRAGGLDTDTDQGSGHMSTACFKPPTGCPLLG